MSDPNHNLADANELPNSELPQGELHDLKRQARTNALRLKIAQQNAALAALRGQGYSDKLEGFSYNDPSNYVDLRDYLFQSPPFFGAMPTTRNDRDQGRDFPVFRTEQELAVIRGAARLITASNPIAVGVLTTLTNYVIGNGFHYAVTPRETSPGAAELAKTAGAVVEDFLSENNWSGDLDRELFQRSRVDGEYFLSLWHVGNGHVQARAVEPDQVTEPGNKTGIDQWLGASRQTDWTFGVHSDVDDAQSVHGFFVQWTNRDLDWNYLPGGNEPIIPPDGAGSWMEHAKLNVVRSVKRGLSDFYPIQGNLEIARRVLRNMGEGSAVQAAIAWIQEVAPGVTQAQVNTGTMSRADASYTTQTQSGSRTHWLQQYDPATILKVPSGQKYLPGPLGAQHAPNFITAAEALLRSVAVRWSLPENLVTGTAENNNFASSLVAESPFVKFAESQQQFYAQRDRRTLERVLWFAWLAGRFGDVEWNAVKRSLHIEVTPPQIEVRDPEKETQVRKTLHDAGLLSRKTWSAQEGLDYEQEQKNLQQEAAAQARPKGSADSQPSPSSPETAKLEELVDLLERFWDPSKHPRGGYPQNTGWFSPGWGSGLNWSGTTPKSSEDRQDKSRADLDKIGKFIVGAYPPEEWLTHADEWIKGLSDEPTRGDAFHIDSMEFRERMIGAQQRALFRKINADNVGETAQQRQPAAAKTKTPHVSYLPSDLVNRLIKQWINSTSLDERSKRILSNVNNILNLRQENLLPFAKGIVTGFFVDGFWGTLSGIKDLGSLAVRGALQADPFTAYLYSQIYGEQPLAPEGRAAINAAKKIAAALPVIQAFAEEVAAGGVAFLDELLSGDPARLANCSQLAQDIGEIAGDVLADVLESLTGIDAETRGRIIGFVLYGIAEAMATAGVGAALKADAACNAARALSKSELLKGYPKVVASLQKSIELITTVLKVNICFVAGTPVHTPRGLAPIETIGIGDLVWTRPEHGADRAKVIRRVTEVAVTNPIEILALELATPVGIETLRCTPGHPFFEIGRKDFVAAENLAEGDRLSLAGDGAATLVTIAAEQPLPGACFTTYNFAVEDCHTYFVGQAAVWVHNTGGQVCSELSSVYRKALRKSAKPEEAAEAVVDHLAKMLAKPNANAKAIEKELAHAKIPELSPKELLDKARAKVAADARKPYTLFNDTHAGSQPIPKGLGPNGGRLHSHHGLQQEWAAKNLPGYEPRLAPTVTVEAGKGFPHTTISNLQNARRDARVAAGLGRWSSTVNEELGFIVSDFRAAGFSDDVIRRTLEQNYKMLDKLGVKYARPAGF